MKEAFTSDDKIGHIASEYPGATDIFKKHGIDFCCGGDRKLSTAIKEGKINPERLLIELNQGYQRALGKSIRGIDWRQESLSNQVDYIINKHHAYLNETLPRTSELTTRILRVHGANHQELSMVHRLFNTLKIELEEHLIKEEEFLFPVIKDYENNPSVEKLDIILQLIFELEDEHENAGDILKKLRKITSGYQVPDDGCNSYRLTYQLLEEMEADLFQHIHLENNLLFPRLERAREKINI
jgi:regulator of cell morphogenesis and NO signaling